MQTRLESASEKLVDAFQRGLESVDDADEFIRLADEFHQLDDDPKKTLVAKDKVLINAIAGFLRGLRGALDAGDITRSEFILLRALALLVVQVEHILWELKQHTGVVPPNEPEPKPEPPKPGPGPQPGPPGPGPEPGPGRDTAGVSPIAPTGEQTRDCGEKDEVEIYSCTGDEAPPRVSITGHGKNSHGLSECEIEFKFYTVQDGQTQLVYTDRVSKGNSTPSRHGRWSKVTAKCLTSPVKNPECRFSWTQH